MAVSTTKVVVISIFLILGMVLAGVLMQPEASLEAWNIKESDFPTNSSAEEKLTFLLNYAILAPSSHNSQPWKFNVSEGDILVFADKSRWLTGRGRRSKRAVPKFGLCPGKSDYRGGPFRLQLQRCLLPRSERSCG